jgi:hypothetical protein
MKSMFFNAVNPTGVDGYGADSSADSINSIYDPGQDRYFEYGGAGSPGWKATISGESPGHVTIADAVMYDVKFNAVKNPISVAKGDQIRFSSASTLPTNLNFDTIYYAVNVSGATFQIAAMPGGTPIDITVGTAPSDLVVIDASLNGGTFGGSMDRVSSWDGIWTKYLDGAGNIKSADPHAQYSSGAIVGYNAVGIAQMLVTVSVAELEAGLIQHAVGIVIPESTLGNTSPYYAHSYPATKNDTYGGPTRKTDCSFPEGARLRLDPEVWTDDYIANWKGAWGKPTPWVQTIMRAARDYGFVVTDTGSNFNVRLQNPGFKGVLKYDGTPYNRSTSWGEKSSAWDTQKWYRSFWAYNQYPEYLPGTPYERPDGNGIFKGATAPGQPNVKDGRTYLGTFPMFALQMLAFDMNGWPKPTCRCTDYTGLGVKTKNPVLHPCYTNP